jgi:hypothetical protein
MILRNGFIGDKMGGYTENGIRVINAFFPGGSYRNRWRCIARSPDSMREYARCMGYVSASTRLTYWFAGLYYFPVAWHSVPPACPRNIEF